MCWRSHKNNVYQLYLNHVKCLKLQFNVLMLKGECCIKVFIELLLLQLSYLGTSISANNLIRLNLFPLQVGIK